MPLVNCLICDKNNAFTIVHKIKHNHLQNVVLCKGCGLMYLNPQKTTQEYDIYYRDEYHHDFMDYFSSQDELLKWWDYQGHYVLEKTASFLKPGAKVLEIGCAGGGILHVFQQAGHHITGLEVSEHWIDFARKKYNILLLNKDLSTLIKQERKFDLIILSHFVEHLLNPVAQLHEIKKLLAPHGTIYVETPNIRDIDLQLGLTNYFCLAHTYYFSPATLKYILNDCGFNIRFTDTGRQALRYLINCDAYSSVQQSSLSLKNEFIKTSLYLMLYQIRHFLNLSLKLTHLC